MDGSAKFADKFSRAQTLHLMRITYLALVGIYILAMVWVWTGIFYASGTRYVDYLVLLVIGFVCTVAVLYFLVFPILRPFAEIDLRIPGDTVAVVLTVLVIGLIVVHWVALGRIPILAAFATDDQMYAALIRDSIGETGIPLLNYIPTVIIRSLVPFLGIYFISRRHYRFAWLILIGGLLYALSLMQKSYPLMVLVPPGIYCFLTWRPIRMLGFAALAVGGVMVSFFAANPPYRPIETAAFFHTGPFQPDLSLNLPNTEPPDQSEFAGASKTSAEITKGMTSYLIRRVFMQPGKVVADWFAIFPEKQPYEEGCGYRFIAPFIGCDFINTPLLLYPLFYPKSASAGLQGSYNAAHFSTEYVNFGPIGLLFSGLLSAGALAAAAVATSRAGLAAAIAINFAAIMALTSSALHTTLLTGGWFFMMALSFALYPPLRNSTGFASFDKK